MSTTNTDRPHQRWTCQLLRRSTLLPHLSTLKLISLPLALGASLRLMFGPHPPPPTDSEVTLYRKGGHNHGRNCRIPRISSPLRFVLRLMLERGGIFAGHYSISLTISILALYFFRNMCIGSATVFCIHSGDGG